MARYESVLKILMMRALYAARGGAQRDIDARYALCRMRSAMLHMRDALPCATLIFRCYILALMLPGAAMLPFYAMRCA